VAAITGATTIGGNLTLNGGTANGVLYLNGSKVATSGTALVFDGTNLGIGTSSPQAKLVASNGGANGFELDPANGFISAFNRSTSAWTKITTRASSYTFNLSNTNDAVNIDASGNLLVGTTSPLYSTAGRGLLEVNGSSSALCALKINNTAGGYLFHSGTDLLLVNAVSGALRFDTNNTERARITAAGEFVVGSTTSAYTSSGRGVIEVNGSDQSLYGFRTGGTARGYLLHEATNLIINNSVSTGALIFQTNATERARITSGGDFQVGLTNYAIIAKGADTNGQGWNGAQTSLYVGSVTGTGRSINAAGTVNASGADYAEYMEKAGNFVIAKGDVCGINANGKLTNVYADAVSFVVKSTNPSYVGNDGWGNNYENDAEGLEAARQKVDRIAFAGQVPVNVLGATPGQYIVPANNNGAIKGVAVSNPSFEQYQAAVGKVIAVEDDGRAKIIVKIA
jgi:hypothetical protein